MLLWTNMEDLKYIQKLELSKLDDKLHVLGMIEKNINEWMTALCLLIKSVIYWGGENWSIRNQHVVNSLAGGTDL